MTPVDKHAPRRVTCLGCGCYCADLTVVLDDSPVVRHSPECPRATEWLEAGVEWRRRRRIEPQARSGGEPLDLESGLAQAVQAVRSARRPLVVGLRSHSLECQRLAVMFAERIGAVLDSSTPADRARMRAIQRVGHVSASWGEVRDRADLVVFWRWDPLRSHPRWIERILQTPGRFQPRGRADRHIIALHDAETPNLTASPPHADFVRTFPGRTAEIVLRSLLASVRDTAPELSFPDSSETGALEAITGIPRDDWSLLRDKLLAARYGVWCAGPCGNPREAETIHRLVRSLNGDHRRFVLADPGADRLSGQPAGAAATVGWQTGYPPPVDYRNGRPEYAPAWCNAESLIQARAVDLVILFGDPDDLAWDDETRAALAELPVIHISPRATWNDPTTRIPVANADSSSPPLRLALASAPLGVAQGGSIARADGPWRVVAPVWTDMSDIPSDEYLLETWIHRLVNA